MNLFLIFFFFFKTTIIEHIFFCAKEILARPVQTTYQVMNEVENAKARNNI
jgi:hypothetical protein